MTPVSPRPYHYGLPAGVPIRLRARAPDAIAVSRGELWVADDDTGELIHLRIQR